MTNGVFTLNLDESFPRLSKAPIVEAVIHWRARPIKQQISASLDAHLSQLFPMLPKISPMHEMKMSASISRRGETTTSHQQDFLGFRLVSDTGQEVVQVLKEGIRYGVIKNYSHWDSFSRKAIAAWDQFEVFAAPNEIQRLSVRFINHFPTVTANTLENTLCEPPSCPANLPLKEFVYRSSFDVPSIDYGVRIIKVLQPPGMKRTSGLFLDIEAYTTKAIPNHKSQIDETLKHLRWLKNKVFFSLLTDTAIDAFSGD